MQAFRNGCRALGCPLLRQQLETRPFTYHLLTERKNLGRSGYGGFATFTEAVFSPATYLDKNEVIRRVVDVVKASQKVDPAKVTPTSHFEGDLELDTMEKVELLMSMELEFAVDVPDGQLDKMNSCAQVVDFIVSHPQAK